MCGQGTSTPAPGGLGGTSVEPTATPVPTVTPEPTATVAPTATPEAGVHIVDVDATVATKSLFAYLDSMSGKQIMFGHQHDTTVSFAGKDKNGNVISDVYSSTGDYPAVFGWDTLSLDGYENPPGVSGDYEASRLGLSAAMKQAHDLGGIVTLSTHPYNMVTGGEGGDKNIGIQFVTPSTAGMATAYIDEIIASK